MTVPNEAEYSAQDSSEDVRRRRDLERLIRWYFPCKEWPRALAAAWYLSGMHALAFHRHGSQGYGLFNIEPESVGLEPGDAWRLHNPIVNVAAAHKLWCEHGWVFWKLPALPTVFDDDPT